MSSRDRAVLIVAAVLACAGCSGGGTSLGGPPSWTTPTPVPIPFPVTIVPNPSPTPSGVFVTPSTTASSPAPIARGGHLDVALYSPASNGTPISGTSSNAACVQTPFRESAPTGGNQNAYYFGAYPAPGAPANCTATITVPDGVGNAPTVYVIVP